MLYHGQLEYMGSTTWDEPIRNVKRTCRRFTIKIEISIRKNGQAMVMLKLNWKTLCHLGKSLTPDGEDAALQYGRSINLIRKKNKACLTCNSNK